MGDLNYKHELFEKVHVYTKHMEHKILSSCSSVTFSPNRPDLEETYDNRVKIFINSPDYLLETETYKTFWKNSKIYLCPDMTAIAMYDFAVSLGIDTAWEQLKLAMLRTNQSISENINDAKTIEEILLILQSKFSEKNTDFSLAIELMRIRAIYINNEIAPNCHDRQYIQKLISHTESTQKFIIQTFYYK